MATYGIRSTAATPFTIEGDTLPVAFTAEAGELGATCYEVPLMTVNSAAAETIQPKLRLRRIGSGTTVKVVTRTILPDTVTLVAVISKIGMSVTIR